jgi:uncharacterized protein (DUF305 family)
VKKSIAFLLALALGLAQHQHGTPTPQTSPERSFLSGMIAHHEGALEMARVALPDLKDPEVRAWAESILKEQDREIGAMGPSSPAWAAWTRRPTRPWPGRWPPWWPG